MGKLSRGFVIVAVFLAAPILFAGCGDEDEPGALVAPVSFTAVYDSGSSSVHTTWASGEGSQDMFMVMRVEQNTEFTTMAWKVDSTQTSYDDSTAQSGVTYVYMVHAMQGEDVSEPSNKVMITIP
jgi:hypothetical protein